MLLNKLNIKSETVNNAVITIGSTDNSGKGKHFKSRFIQAGLVKIENHGIVLLRKETIDNSLKSMIGSPVIIKHQDVTNKNADDLRCGVISDAYFNDEDGWYYAEGVIWDEEALGHIQNGWSVSCSYDFTEYDDAGGVENNIKYDKEFTKLNFTHLALVDNPRYERANIVFNSNVDNENKNHYPDGTPDGKKDVRDISGRIGKHNWTNEELDILDKPHTDYVVFNPDNIYIKKKDIVNSINNSKEQEMALLDELKKLISKVENEKGEPEMDEKEKVDNKKVDKRKLINEVGGILKGKVDDEIIRTVMKKMEEASYNSSEDSKADNEKDEKDENTDNCGSKVKNEDKKDKEKVEEIKEDVEKDVENKCGKKVENSKPEDCSSFDKINEIYNSVKQITEPSQYESKQDRLDNAVEYFK